jgi:hypothetical protein
MKKYNLLIFILINLSLNTYAQFIGVRHLKSESVSQEDYLYKIIDLDGNTVLELPEKVVPFLSSFLLKKYDHENDNWEIKVNDRWILEDRSIFFIDSSQRILPLTTPDSTYLVDFSGKVVKSFGTKYSFLSQPSQGIFLAFRQIENQYAYMISYLNENGDQLFNGKEFWEATLFSEGLAIVQEENKNGDWKIINLKGEEVVNLSKNLNKKIVKAYPFIGGYANIIFKRDEKESFDIRNRIKDNKDSLARYFNLPIGSNSDELRISNILARVNSKGGLEVLSWGQNTLSDIYYRSHYQGADYHNISKIVGNTGSVQLIDSLLTINDKFYIGKSNDSNKTKIINAEGKTIEFPERYSPIKCIQNLILGKRNKNYVLFDYDNKVKTYFTDKTPLHVRDIVDRSEDNHKNLEEFILIGNRIIKIGIQGLESILDLEGKLILDNEALNTFEENGIDLPKSVRDMMLEYECLDQQDIAEINENGIEHLNINCEVVDFKYFIDMKNLKMISVRNISKIINSSLIKDLLNKGVQIGLEGSVTLQDIKIDLSKVVNGYLVINEDEIIKKK